jgi:hypothetical protein
MIDKVMDAADEAFYSDSRFKRPKIAEQKERLLKAQDKRDRRRLKALNDQLSPMNKRKYL